MLTAPRLWTVLVALECIACVGVNPSASDVIGKWRVSWTCGVEALELKADGTYAYSVTFPSGEAATDQGHWEVIPMESRLNGAGVRLKAAHLGCSPSGKRTKNGEREDRTLRTIFEWGRTILSFHPDIQGFTRG